MSIGDNIRERRKKMGMTQKELAEKAIVATGTIQQYELGKRQPRIEQLKRIADVLGVSVESLMIPVAIDSGVETSEPTTATGVIGISSEEQKTSIKERFLNNLRAIFGLSQKELRMSDELYRYAVITNSEDLPAFDDAIKIGEIFLELNRDGRKKVIDYAMDLTGHPQYQRLPDERLLLWPHNGNAEIVDKEYYAAMPSVPKVAGYQEYVKCFPIEGDEESKYNPYAFDRIVYRAVELYTEIFKTWDEAEHFLQAARKKYYVRSENIKMAGQKGYVVYAYALGDVIRNAFDIPGCYWLLENWA